MAGSHVTRKDAACSRLAGIDVLGVLGLCGNAAAAFGLALPCAHNGKTCWVLLPSWHMW